MQKTHVAAVSISERGRQHYLPGFCFLIIVLLLFMMRAFPALYGDEYGSLFEAQHLTSNLHAVGYLLQLHLWIFVATSDFFLRVLSVLWLGAGLYWLNHWLQMEEISDQVRNTVLWLALLNPFLWMYGLQIRFYAMFFGTSVLFLWRFREWQKSPISRNVLSLLLSLVLLLTSHLFGVLVIATTVLYYLWMQLGNKRWALGLLIAFAGLITLLPPTRFVLVNLVYRLTANPPPTDISLRGLSLGMLAKIPTHILFFHSRRTSVSALVVDYIPGNDSCQRGGWVGSLAVAPPVGFEPIDHLDVAQYSFNVSGAGPVGAARVARRGSPLSDLCSSLFFGIDGFGCSNMGPTETGSLDRQSGWDVLSGAAAMEL